MKELFFLLMFCQMVVSAPPDNKIQHYKTFSWNKDNNCWTEISDSYSYFVDGKLSTSIISNIVNGKQKKEITKTICSQIQGEKYNLKTTLLQNISIIEKEDSNHIMQPYTKIIYEYIIKDGKEYSINNSIYHYDNSKWVLFSCLHNTYDSAMNLIKKYTSQVQNQFIAQNAATFTYNSESQQETQIEHHINSLKKEFTTSKFKYFYNASGKISEINLWTMQDEAGDDSLLSRTFFKYNNMNKIIEKSQIKYNLKGQDSLCVNKETYIYDDINNIDTIYYYSLSGASLSDTLLRRNINKNLIVGDSVIADSSLHQIYKNNQWQNTTLKVLMHDTNQTADTSIAECRLFKADILNNGESSTRIISLKALMNQKDIRISVYDFSNRNCFNYMAESIEKFADITTNQLEYGGIYYINIISNLGRQIIKVEVK